MKELTSEAYANPVLAQSSFRTGGGSILPLPPLSLSIRQGLDLEPPVVHQYQSTGKAFLFELAKVTSLLCS